MLRESPAKTSKPPKDFPKLCVVTNDMTAEFNTREAEGTNSLLGCLLGEARTEMIANMGLLVQLTVNRSSGIVYSWSELACVGAEPHVQRLEDAIHRGGV